MATAIVQQASLAEQIETVLLTGDLSKLTAEQRMNYFKQVCASLGLNPLTKPFEYIVLNGKMVLYAKRDATEQLRKIHKVSVTSLSSQRVEDVYVVTATVQDSTGRTDSSTGAVCIGTAKGEALANVLMKAETKAKRRATLSICGLGMLDESEVGSVPDAAPVATLQPAQRKSATVPLNSLPADKEFTPVAEISLPTIAKQLNAGTHPDQQPVVKDPKMISEPQRRRFYAICKKARWEDEHVKEVLKMSYGLASSSMIPKAQYETICKHFEGGPNPIEPAYDPFADHDANEELR